MDKQDNIYYAYVDGNYINGFYCYAFIIVKDDKILYTEVDRLKDRVGRDLKNVAGEIKAAWRAIEYAVEYDINICICYDYIGVENFATGIWSTKNKWLNQYIDYAKKYKDRLSFKKIKAHSGNKYNNYVDKLAQSAFYDIDINYFKLRVEGV